MATQGATHEMKPESLEHLGRDLERTFEFSIDRKPEIQRYHMQTQFVHLGFDGIRTNVETYLLRLRCIPAAVSGNKLDEYTCSEFGLKLNKSEIVTLPVLRNLTYHFDVMAGVITKGPLWAIPQDPFLGMKDSLGNEFPSDIC